MSLLPYPRSLPWPPPRFRAGLVDMALGGSRNLTVSRGAAALAGPLGRLGLILVVLIPVVTFLTPLA